MQVSQGLNGTYRDILTTYWQQTISSLENDTHDYKLHQLPLARIKKVMKADPDVKMISAEAPILFAKGCDVFITELTMRAWIHAEENKRRTLQRSDIASALAKSDMFDFLIDIVPREEAASHAKRSGQGAGAGSGNPAAQASSGNQIMPPQNNVQQQPPSGHSQQTQPQHMGHPEYAPLANSQLQQEQEYRPQPGMYAAQVQPDTTTAYGQPQQPMFEGMYGYAPMPTQQVGCLIRRPSKLPSADFFCVRCTKSIKEPKIHQVAKIQATSIKDMMEARGMPMQRASGIMKLVDGLTCMLVCQSGIWTVLAFMVTKKRLANL